MLTTGLLCMQQTLDCQEREENREYLNEPGTTQLSCFYNSCIYITALS